MAAFVILNPPFPPPWPLIAAWLCFTLLMKCYGWGHYLTFPVQRGFWYTAFNIYIFRGMCRGHRYKHTRLRRNNKTYTDALNVQNNLCFKCFNTTYHYSLWVSALPVLSLCPTLLLSSPSLIFRPLKGAAPHLLVPRHLKSSGAVERTPTSLLCLWFHLSTSHEAKHGGVARRAFARKKSKKSFQVTVVIWHTCR